MKLLGESILAPSAEWCGGHACMFPGLCVKPGGSLALLAVAGTAFESADQRTVVYTGSADGLTWQPHGDIGEVRSNGHLFCTSAKPTALPNGRIVALGYGFEREEPELSISGYAEKHGDFPKVRNYVQFSEDGGISYTPPKFLEHGYGGIEFSGPSLRLTDGRLLAFGSPFGLKAAEAQIGLCFESTDDGQSWHEKSVFHRSGSVTCWECRGTQLPDGRIAVVSWAFDLATQRHLTNCLALSADGAENWQSLDTGLPGQAANLLPMGDGTVGIVQARREGDHPGIYLTVWNLANAKPERTMLLYDVAGGANVAGKITDQFYNLKFGQPALHRLEDGTFLLVFWRCTGPACYEIVIRKLLVIG